MAEQLECFVCGEGLLISQTANVEGSLKGENLWVECEALVCNKCGHISMEGSAMPEYMRKVADAYRTKYELLTSDDIVARRNALGMTQKQFAEYLGAGEASIKRWELGQVQDASMDQLLRLKTDLQEADDNAAYLRARLAADPNHTIPVKWRKTSTSEIVVIVDHHGKWRRTKSRLIGEMSNPFESPQMAAEFIPDESFESSYRA